MNQGLIKLLLGKYLHILSPGHSLNHTNKIGLNRKGLRTWRPRKGHFTGQSMGGHQPVVGQTCSYLPHNSNSGMHWEAQSLSTLAESLIVCMVVGEYNEATTITLGFLSVNIRYQIVIGKELLSSERHSRTYNTLDQYSSTYGSGRTPMGYWSLFCMVTATFQNPACDLLFPLSATTYLEDRQEWANWVLGRAQDQHSVPSLKIYLLEMWQEEGWRPLH